MNIIVILVRLLETVDLKSNDSLSYVLICIKSNEFFNIINLMQTIQKIKKYNKKH